MEFFTVRALLLLTGALELALAALASRWIDRETTFPLYLSLYFAMAVPWLVASYVAFREPLAPSSQRRDRALVLGIAILLRASFLPITPVLSDDIFRYIWDGRVQHAGINPYVHPPEAPELAFLRDARYEGINNKDIPTIYPPLMQTAFFVATSVSESVLWMKGFFVLFDLALVLLLMRLLEALALSPLRALVYAWSPLAVVEVAGSGHNDILAVFFLMASLLALERGQKTWSLVLLTGSGLSKLLGLALAPLFVRFVKVRLYGVIPIATLLVALPYASAGRLAFRGLGEYGQRWRGNDSLFHVLFALTGSLDRAKLAVAAILVAFVLVLALKKIPPLTASFWTVSAILLLMPTVHPWYLLWVLPFLAVFQSPAWMFLTVSVGLSYHAAYLATTGAPWEELLWVKLLEYVPFFIFGFLLGLPPLRAALARLGSHDTRASS